jgi:hypothetical protein
MSWFKNIISGKNSDKEKKQKLLKKIEFSINNCQTEIQKAEKEIKQIRKWMAGLIHENFFVPGNFWYEELKYYQEIKAHKENSNIPKEKVSEIDRLLADYHTQIHFREKKIELKKLMIEKYHNAKQQLNSLEQNISQEIKNTHGLKTLEKHQNRIQKLNQTQYNSEQEQAEVLQQLIFQINELIENKQIDEEVKAFMKKLNTQFSSEVYENNPERIISEMERLIEEYKAKK